MFGEFASAQLLVAPPPCEDSDCDEDHGELATEEDVGRYTQLLLRAASISQGITPAAPSRSAVP